MIGRTVLHYRITEELGAGGLGRVYLAWDERVGRKVALKFLDASVSDNPTRLRREAQAAAKLAHPGIVTLLSLEETQGESFLVQEYIEGETLASRLARGALGSPEALRLALELARALAHAHGRGVFHRDLKPANVLIASDGSYKIADFGVARIEGEVTSSEPGALRGTLPYMAPERIRGSPGDARADLFSLGAVVYEAITGQRAFLGTTETEIMYAVMNRQPPSPPADSPQLCKLVSLVERLLEKEPRDRPPTANYVAAALAPTLGDAHPLKGLFANLGWTRWAVAAVAIGVTAVVAWWIPGHRPQIPGGPILVMPFENMADARDPERVGLVAFTLLVTRLAQADSLEVVGTERTLELLNQLPGGRAAGGPKAADQVGRRIRARKVVVGSILRVAPSLYVTAEVTDAPSGRVLNAVRVQGLPEQSVFEVVDRLASQLIPTLSRNGRAPLIGSGGEQPAQDPEAYQRYVEGLEYLAQGELSKAEAAFDAALLRDPELRKAQDYLALVEWRRSNPGERVAP